MPPYRALVTRSGEDRGKPYFQKNASRLQPGEGRVHRDTVNRSNLGITPGVASTRPTHNRHPPPTPPLPTTVVPAQAGTQGTGVATTTTVIPHQHPLFPPPSCRRRPVPRRRARQPPQPSSRRVSRAYATRAAGNTVILWPLRSVIRTQSPSLNGSAERLRTRTVSPEGSLIPYSVNSPRNSR